MENYYTQPIHVHYTVYESECCKSCGQSTTERKEVRQGNLVVSVKGFLDETGKTLDTLSDITLGRDIGNYLDAKEDVLGKSKGETYQWGIWDIHTFHETCLYAKEQQVPV